MVFLFKEPHVRTETIVEKLKMVDWIGQFLIISSATAIIIPITWVRLLFTCTGRVLEAQRLTTYREEFNTLGMAGVS